MCPFFHLLNPSGPNQQIWFNLGDNCYSVSPKLFVLCFFFFFTLQHPGALCPRPDPRCQSSGGIHWTTAIWRNLRTRRLLELRPHGVCHRPYDQQGCLQTGVIQVSHFFSFSVLHPHLIFFFFLPFLKTLRVSLYSIAPTFFMTQALSICKVSSYFPDKTPWSNSLFYPLMTPAPVMPFNLLTKSDSSSLETLSALLSHFTSSHTLIQLQQIDFLTETFFLDSQYEHTI